MSERSTVSAVALGRGRKPGGAILTMRVVPPHVPCPIGVTMGASDAITVSASRPLALTGTGDAALIELAPEGRARFDDDLGHLEVGPVGRRGHSVRHEKA